MADTSEIQPALTAARWARVRDNHGIPVEIAAVMAAEGDDWHGAVALCNHALPDDDPRKITRADVELIQKHAEYNNWHTPQGEVPDPALSALAAKLAALLPPTE